ncbi:GntR family transcriptional regulator [Salinicola avicenniae]|uniref:GntR family transcriptional regulator n=1 Tax=Salinicola avicenniae TaxID=2916836 RepID=UPI0020730F39|nr:MULTISPECIES: GntR family transcriptional regulator [unclassified Salinicola]
MIRNLKRTTLRDQCLDGLRAAITSGQLHSGQHLVETELSEAFGVSRGTLREAMRRLEQEGLLVAGPRGQLSVRAIDKAELGHIYEVRTALEVLAAQRLRAQPDHAQRLAHLREALARLQRVEGDLGEQIEADLDFHRTLCEQSGNPALLTTWLSLEGAIRISVMQAGLDRALRNMSADRHHLIVDTLERGDPGEIEDELQRHMREAVARLVSAYETSDADS